MSEELNQVLRQRRQKATDLADLGVNIYANDFKPTHPVKDLLAMAEEITDETEPSQGQTYTIGGRIMALRKFGKAAFLHIQDESGRIQIYIKRDVVGVDAYAIFKKPEPRFQKAAASLEISGPMIAPITSMDGTGRTTLGCHIIGGKF